MAANQRQLFGRRRWTGFLLLAVCCCAVSCKFSGHKSTNTGGGNPLLHPVPMSQEAVSIDVFMVRIPLHHRELLRQLWAEVDEQWGSPTLRRELMNQGLRVGIQGVSLSPALTKLINATAAPSTLSADPTEISVAELQKDPIVKQQSRQMLPGMHTLFQPYADSVPEMPIFWHENGYFCGKTFKDAEGLIGLVATPLKGGQVRFEITPEVAHGTVETKYNFHGGVMFTETAKSRHPFGNLAVSLDLLPGQWIVMGPVSENCSGIGRCFFTRDRGETEQKVILIRLARSQRNNLFDNETLFDVPPGDSRMLDRN